MTDRAGIVHFDIAPVTGKIQVDGLIRCQGRLDGAITIELLSDDQRGERT